MQTTDAQLVRLSQENDTAAFGELVRRYQGLVHGLAYHRVGSFTDAQDIAQESFVKAFRRLAQLAEPDRFAPWLKAIAVNECKMWLRTNREAVALDEAELLPSYSALAAERWRRDQGHAEVRRAVDSLPERSRLVVALHYLSGQSQQEIGEFLGVSANAVAQHLHRARRQLKEMLMAGVEEDYTMNKLPESFAEEVLGRVTLYPVLEGQFMTGKGEGDASGINLAVTEPDSGKSYITFWTRDEDLGEIVAGTLPATTSENAKGRALDSCLGILSAFGIDLTRVVLRVKEGRKCRADAEFTQGRRELTVDMRPSDAMGLAVRVGAPILAEGSVIERGNVGEDDVPTPDWDMDAAAQNTFYRQLPRFNAVIDKAFELASTKDWIDTIRFHKDQAGGTLRVWAEAIPERESSFGLDEYADGIDMIFDYARSRSSSGKMIGGDPAHGFRETYKFLFSMLGEDARMRVVREEDERQPADT